MQYSIDNHSQGTLARGWRDTKRGWADWRFWMIEVFGGGPIAIWGAYAALAFVAGAAGAVWVAATLRAPYVQRNEARKELILLREVYGANDLNDVQSWTVNINSPTKQRYEVHPDGIVVCDWRFANASSTQSRVLDISFELSGSAIGQEPMYFATEIRNQPIKEREEEQKNSQLKVLKNPIEIPPNSYVEGDVEFLSTGGMRNLHSGPGFFMFSIEKFVVIDRRSGKTIVVPGTREFSVFPNQRGGPVI